LDSVNTLFQDARSFDTGSSALNGGGRLAIPASIWSLNAFSAFTGFSVSQAFKRLAAQ
jgi:hypothetical protein